MGDELGARCEACGRLNPDELHERAQTLSRAFSKALEDIAQLKAIVRAADALIEPLSKTEFCSRRSSRSAQR